MLAVAWCGLLLCAAPPAAPVQQDTGLRPLQRDLERIAAEAGPGTVLGAAAVHLETGRRVAVRGGDRFGMMSVYKFPIGLFILKQVERGRFRLDQPVRIDPGDLRPGHSPLADAHPRGATLPLRELVRLAVEESDNTASDALVRIAGGGAAITDWLRSLGVEGVRIDREEGVIAADYFGIEWTSPRGPTPAVLDSARRHVSAAARRASAARYAVDPRDTSTPDGMARLLVLFEQGRVLRPENARIIREMMVRTPTGANRLRSGLPRGTEVAHKTGTSATTEGVTAAVNDVGVITLPGGRGRVAVAVFVRNARGTEAGERLIARVAEAVYRHWTKESPES